MVTNSQSDLVLSSVPTKAEPEARVQVSRTGADRGERQENDEKGGEGRGAAGLGTQFSGVNN